MTKPLSIVTVDDEPLALRRLEQILAGIEGVKLVGSAGSCREGRDLIRERGPDVVLLDVSLRDGTGFDLLDGLDLSPLPAVIFITGSDAHALRAFEIRAADYVLKPVDPLRLARALAGARERLAARPRSPLSGDDAKFLDELWIKNHHGGYVRVAVADIVSVTSEGDFVKIRARGRNHLMRATVTRLQASLDPDAFVRTHRSAIISLKALVEFKRSPSGGLWARLADGGQVPVGRVYAQALKRRIAARKGPSWDPGSG